jgi:hypothetical protein
LATSEIGLKVRSHFEHTGYIICQHMLRYRFTSTHHGHFECFSSACSFDSQFMNMSKTGVSGTVYEMEDMGATKELTQAMMDTIANDVAESSNARVTSRPKPRLSQEYQVPLDLGYQN